MKCSIQLGFASFNGTFHLSAHENMCTIAFINIHYLYTIICVICIMTIGQICQLISLTHDSRVMTSCCSQLMSFKLWTSKSSASALTHSKRALYYKEENVEVCSPAVLTQAVCALCKEM